LILIKELPGNASIGLSMTESKKADQAATVDQNAVSAVKLSAGLTADIDAWASVHVINRSEAIRRLIELGLKSEAMAMRVSRRDAVAAEALAASLINQFIDPDTPQEERERRIHRLTEGPPEFVDLRIDLPKRGH
jgi:superfamily II DNA or RNA helicase